MLTTGPAGRIAMEDTLSETFTTRVLELNDLIWQPLAMPVVLVVVGGLLLLTPLRGWGRRRNAY